MKREKFVMVTFREKEKTAKLFYSSKSLRQSVAKLKQNPNLRSIKITKYYGVHIGFIFPLKRNRTS